MTWKEFKEKVDKVLKNKDIDINFIDINENFDITELKIKLFKRPNGEKSLNIY